MVVLKLIEHTLTIPEEMASFRLDKALSELFPQYSRSKLVEWIKSGQIAVDGHKLLPKFKVLGKEEVVIKAKLEGDTEHKPEPIVLDIQYEDEYLLILNKRANQVVHPAAGHHNGTLLNGLLNHCPDLNQLPRAGIVHRLDKDTTGLMVVAKTLEAHTGLVKLLQDRDISRHYYGLVQGYMISGGTVETHFARHPFNRLKMAVVKDGKLARTHYRVLRRYPSHTLLDIKLDTGRTHQIRVHMSHIKYPLVGDQLYGGRSKLPKGCSPELRNTLLSFGRQALHAYRLAFVHPITGESVDVRIPLAQDVGHLLGHLGDPDLEATRTQA